MQKETESDDYIFMDFEFNTHNKRFYNLICAATYTATEGHTWDLRPESGKKLFIDYLNKQGKDIILVSYGLSAEIRALFSLYDTENLDDLPFKYFIDLHAEHRLLANRHKELTTGELYVDGKLTKIPFHPEKKKQGFDNINLLNALHTVNGSVEEKHLKAKDFCRDICINGWDREIDNYIDTIKDYCLMDTAELPKLLDNMVKIHCDRGTDPGKLVFDMLDRGQYVACTAEAEQRGYYIDIDRFNNLTKNYGSILGDICKNVLERFPRYNTFSFDPKSNLYSFHVGEAIRYIEDNYPPEFVRSLPKTEKTNKISVSVDTLEKFYGHIRHTLSDEDYLQQVYKYLYTRSSLSGLVRRNEKSGRKSMAQYLDEKRGVVHPYLNPFGSQTGRNQPPANGFIMGKPAWMRCLLSTPEDQALVAIDCGKQEFLYWGIASKDEKLIEAYKTGDPYVSFGLDVGILKEEMRGTEEWDAKRHACKTIVLMIFFGAGPTGLATKLQLALGRKVHFPEAANYIRLFEKNYPNFRKMKERIPIEYRKDRKLSLLDGWTMWEHNYNKRSVVNFPIQGGCAEVMRHAVIDARERGIVCNMTQHDSFMTYVDFKGEVLNWKPIKTLCESIRYSLRKCTGWAKGSDLLTLDVKIIHKNIDKCKNKLDKLEIEYYGIRDSDFTVDDIKYGTEYIDPRAVGDLKQFRRYLI